jgi:heterotetrameric sarcosine oxidase delta subunit
MYVIPCPWCGPRDQREFGCGGEAHRARPPQPEALSEAEWAGYLFMRRNPKGLHHERWVHSHGCRQWFNVARNTATDRILAAYRIGAPPPELDTQAPPTPSGEPPIGSGEPAVGPERRRS